MGHHHGIPAVSRPHGRRHTTPIPAVQPETENIIVTDTSGAGRSTTGIVTPNPTQVIPEHISEFALVGSH